MLESQYAIIGYQSPGEIPESRFHGIAWPRVAHFVGSSLGSSFGAEGPVLGLPQSDDAIQGIVKAVVPSGLTPASITCSSPLRRIAIGRPVTGVPEPGSHVVAQSDEPIT